MQQGSPPIRRPRLRDNNNGPAQNYNHHNGQNQFHHQQQQQQQHYLQSQQNHQYHPHHGSQQQQQQQQQSQQHAYSNGHHSTRSPWESVNAAAMSTNGNGNNATQVANLMQQAASSQHAVAQHHAQTVTGPPPPLMVDINHVPVSLPLRAEPLWASICTYPAPPPARLAPCHLHGIYTQPFTAQACNSHPHSQFAAAPAGFATAGAPIQVTQVSQAPQQVTVATAAHPQSHQAALVGAAAANYQQHLSQQQRTDVAAAAAVAGLSLEPTGAAHHLDGHGAATAAAHPAQLQATPIHLTSMSAAAVAAHHYHSAAVAAAAQVTQLATPQQIIISTDVSILHMSI